MSQWHVGRELTIDHSHDELAPQRRHTATSVLLLCCVVAGGLVAHLAMPAIFRSMRTQTKRIEYVLRALRTSDEPPSLLAFGDSTVMYGLDARLLSELLPPPRPVAWNVASPAAQLVQTRLLLQEVPVETETIIIGVSLAHLASATQTIPSSVYNALLMSGYRPTPETLADCLGAASKDLLHLFETPMWRVPFEARWAVRAALDELARPSPRQASEDARRSLRQTREEEYRDLYFPGPFRRRMPERVLKHQFRRRFHTREDFRIAPKARQLLLSMDALGKSEGYRVVFVVMPEHPRWRDYTSPKFGTQVERELGELADVEFLNLRELLGEEFFVDHAHHSREGADLITQSIASYLSDLE